MTVNIQTIKQALHHESFQKDELTGVFYATYLQALKEDALDDWISAFNPNDLFDRTIVFSCHAVRQFQEYGQQVFYLSQDIAWMLNMTKLPKLPLDVIKFPYPGFYIKIPESMNLLLTDEDKQLDVVTGVYVTDFSHIRENTDLIGQDIPRILFHIITKSVVGASGFGNYSFIISDHRDDLEKYIDDAALEVSNADSLKSVLRIAFNLLFYLNAENAETEKVDNDAEIRELKCKLKNNKLKDHKRCKLQKRLNRAKKQAVVTIVAPSLKVKHLSCAGSSGISRRRHWVRGHHHHYWTGSGEDRQIILKWVKAFERGDTAAEVIRKHYEVK